MITRAFLLALAMIESGNRDIPGDNGFAQGPFQMHTIMVDEANRIVELKGLPKMFIHEDRHDYHASAIMAKIVLDYWSKHWAKKGHTMTYPDMVAFWRWGSPWTPDKTDSTQLDRDRGEKITKIMK